MRPLGSLGENSGFVNHPSPVGVISGHSCTFQSVWVLLGTGRSPERIHQSTSQRWHWAVFRLLNRCSLKKMFCGHIG